MVGGSLGAVAINELVDEEIDELVKVYDVIHLRGKGNGAKRKKGYYPIEFTNEINEPSMSAWRKSWAGRMLRK